MVAAIGLLVPFTGVLEVAGIALTTVGGGLTVAGTLVNLAASLLVSTAASALLAPEIVSPESVRRNSKVATAPRARHYGVVRVGGTIVFERASGNFVYRIIVHGHGVISRILNTYLNSEPVALRDNGYVANDQYYHNRDRVRVLGRMGIVPETAYSEVTAVWSDWTASHRLDGLWTSLLVCEDTPVEQYNAMYPKGAPELTVKAESTECYDPRTTLTKFTTNPALVFADYIKSPDGLNRPDVIDWGNITAEADKCDEAIMLDAGGTEPKYQISMTYLLNEKPQNVLARILASCAGRVRLLPAGKISLQVGTWTAPSLTLTFDQLVEVKDIAPGRDRLDRYNTLPARFNSHAHGFVELDAEMWTDPIRAAEDGETLIGPVFSILSVPTHRQARQVMKIKTERDNPHEIVKMVLKPSAMEAIYEQQVTLSMPEIGLSGDYEVQGYAMATLRGVLRSVSLDLRKIDSSSMTLTLSEQGQVQPAPPWYDLDGISLPENVVAVGYGVPSQFNPSVNQTGFAIGWRPPIGSGLAMEVRYKRSDTDAWQTQDVLEADSNVVFGTNAPDYYDLELRYKLAGGQTGPVVRIGPILPLFSVPPAPSPPTSLAVAQLGVGHAQVSFVTSASAAHWKTEIYRDGVHVADVHEAAGVAVTYNDACGAGTFDWAARSINVGGVAATSDAGPVTATIT